MEKQLKEIINKSEKIVFFGGAGVSTESNIPDFRSESGLYNAQRQYGYSPETMLSYTFYRNNMDLFYDYYKNNLVYKNAEPNMAHKALAKLEEEGKLIGVITQNIDGLHQSAGSKKVYELHGSVHRNKCTKCATKYSLDYVLDDLNCKGNIPICSKCGGVVKPEVVLYEESLNQQTIEGAVNAISNADTLIVGGTSLAVYPAAGLIQYFGGKNLVLINKTKTQYDKKANLVINEPIGEVLERVVLK